MEFMDQNNCDFLQFEDIFSSLNEALNDIENFDIYLNFIKYKKLDELKLDLISKKLEEDTLLGNLEKFDLISPLFIPDRNLKTVLHKILESFYSDKKAEKIHTLIKIKEILGEKFSI